MVNMDDGGIWYCKLSYSTHCWLCMVIITWNKQTQVFLNTISPRNFKDIHIICFSTKITDRKYRDIENFFLAVNKWTWFAWRDLLNSHNLQALLRATKNMIKFVLGKIHRLSFSDSLCTVLCIKVHAPSAISFSISHLGCTIVWTSPKYRAIVSIFDGVSSSRLVTFQTALKDSVLVQVKKCSVKWSAKIRAILFSQIATDVRPD